MSLDLSQDGRVGQFTTALGTDVLLLTRFAGSDHVNDLFDYQVSAQSAEPDIDFDQLIGTHATVELESPTQGTHAFDGIVTEARWAGVGENGFQYELRLRPWLWLAGRRRNQRIFHEMTVVDILQELFSPYGGMGAPALKTELSGSYPTLEYTVQYRESDMDFAVRLMERFGISYYFTHDVGSHTLVLSDDVFAHPKVPGNERPFNQYGGHHHAENEHFWEWLPTRRLSTGAVRLMDFNFKTPAAAMEVDRTGDATYENGQIESYDYPGDYIDQAGGKDVAALRMRQEQGRDDLHRALGDCMSLSAGMTLSLTGDHASGACGKDYLCLSAQHVYTADSYSTGTTSGGERAYSGQYIMMPTSCPLVPVRNTPVPTVRGPQTATVVGNGEIDCDDFGRILVLFHWDLEKANSMRCRVSQNWAGKGFGGMAIPRIGMEVVVEFLEGDPDKPLVTGCVYNGKNDVPYPLPANKTRSTFKSDSHQGEGFNELRFEDESGAEEIYIHAQKDRNEKTLNNHSERVDNNMVQSVGHNKAVEVKNNHEEVIGGNMTLSIGPSGIGQLINEGLAGIAAGVGDVAAGLGIPGAGNPGEGNLSVIVGKAKSEIVTTTSSTKVGISASETVGVSSSLDVGKSIDVTVGMTHTLDVGDAATETIGKTKTTTIGEVSSTTVGKELSLQVGEDATETVGKKKVIDVGDELIIKVGKSQISMKKDGTITFSGKDINLKGSGKISAKASKNVTIKGSKVLTN